MNVIIDIRNMSKSINKKINKYLLLMLFVAIVVLLVYGFVAFKIPKTSKPKTTAKNTNAVNVKKAQKNTNSEDKKLVNNSSSKKFNFNDTNGNDRSSSSPSKWTGSQDGKILLKQPAQSQLVGNSFSIIGIAYSDNLNFRVIDESSGVLGQGRLNIVNNNFSSSIQLEPKSKNGRLDVFSVRDDGTENSEIQIELVFK